jgi:hypothetical protein
MGLKRTHRCFPGCRAASAVSDSVRRSARMALLIRMHAQIRGDGLKFQARHVHTNGTKPAQPRTKNNGFRVSPNDYATLSPQTPSMPSLGMRPTWLPIRRTPRPSYGDERAASEATGFELAYCRTARVIRTYACESAALAFVRDVVLFGSHADAAQFRLQRVAIGLQVETVAEGERLVRRALEDRIL